MRLNHRLSFLAVVMAAVSASACGTDNPTSPAARKPATEPSATLLGSPLSVRTLQWKTPLAAPITVSKTVGLLGGTIAIPGTGLTVVIPPAAVTKSITITVTALAGSAVAYEFAPSGTKFLLPLVVTQDFTKTKTSGLNLSLFQGGYFKNVTDINQANGTATVSELLNLSVTLQPFVGVFSVTHFSGYLVSTGCDE